MKEMIKTLELFAAIALAFIAGKDCKDRRLEDPRTGKIVMIVSYLVLILSIIFSPIMLHAIDSQFLNSFTFAIVLAIVTIHLFVFYLSCAATVAMRPNKQFFYAIGSEAFLLRQAAVVCPELEQVVQESGCLGQGPGNYAIIQKIGV